MKYLLYLLLPFLMLSNNPMIIVTKATVDYKQIVTKNKLNIYGMVVCGTHIYYANKQVYNNLVVGKKYIFKVGKNNSPIITEVKINRR